MRVQLGVEANRWTFGQSLLQCDIVPVWDIVFKILFSVTIGAA
jgi:hypothetical protein